MYRKVAKKALLTPKGKGQENGLFYGTRSVFVKGGKWDREKEYPFSGAHDYFLVGERNCGKTGKNTAFLGPCELCLLDLLFDLEDGNCAFSSKCQ
jgi:hypothetical protein